MYQLLKNFQPLYQVEMAAYCIYGMSRYVQELGISHPLGNEEARVQTCTWYTTMESM